jgi:hypothetical protein
MHLLEIVMVHDMSDAVDLDIIPADKIAAEVKHERERIATQQVLEKLGPAGLQYLKRWDEFEERKTREAVVAFHFDNIAPVVRALQLERTPEYFDRVQNFYPYARGRVTDDEFLRIHDILMARKYPDIDPIRQYELLLLFKGNVETFDYVASGVPEFVDRASLLQIICAMQGQPPPEHHVPCCAMYEEVDGVLGLDMRAAMQRHTFETIAAENAISKNK